MLGSCKQLIPVVIQDSWHLADVKVDKRVYNSNSIDPHDENAVIEVVNLDPVAVTIKAKKHIGT